MVAFAFLTKNFGKEADILAVCECSLNSYTNKWWGHLRALTAIIEFV